MILEGEFSTGGHLRWILGWPTPNFAGAFLATLLALAFVFSGSRWRWAALAAEVGGVFLLAKTYSRGAVVAYGLAWLFGVIASRSWREPSQRLIWAARIVGLAVMMLMVGFGWSRAKDSGDRTIHGMVASADARLGRDKSDGPARSLTAEKMDQQEDGSVVNRLALWRGGLKMIAAAPLAGWGAGESGRAYMNWYQDIDRTEGFTTMVNSYLHVGVEHGLPVLAVVLWVGAWLLLASWRGARNEVESPASRLLQMAMGASLVTWSVANVFTTLWIEPKLWIVPVAAAMVIATATVRRRRQGGGWRSDLGVAMLSLGISVAVVTGLYAAGWWLMRSRPEQASPGSFGTVVVTRSNSSAGKSETWHVWPDPAVLGATPGKELRRWLESESANIRLIVHRAAPLQLGEVPAGAVGMLLFGRQAERVGPGFSPDCRELWLIHPTAPPPEQGKGANQSLLATTVILPQIDETGSGPAWREWAKQTGTRLVESPACGLDIRAVWPAVMSLGKKIGPTTISP